VSVVGSIVAVLVGDSITPVSNPGDYKDIPILPLFDNDSEPECVEAPQHQRHTVVVMATGGESLNDPCTTLLPATETAGDIEAHRVALKA
jgi:hypothetical protein